MRSAFGRCLAEGVWSKIMAVSTLSPNAGLGGKIGEYIGDFCPVRRAVGRRRTPHIEVVEVNGSFAFARVQARPGPGLPSEAGVAFEILECLGYRCVRPVRIPRHDRFGQRSALRRKASVLSSNAALVALAGTSLSRSSELKPIKIGVSLKRPPDTAQRLIRARCPHRSAARISMNPSRSWPRVAYLPK
jgi:hypothetical protein